MKSLLDLTTTTWLEHGKNHAAADKDYVTDQFDSDEGDKYEDDDDKDDNADDDGNMMKPVHNKVISGFYALPSGRGAYGGAGTHERRIPADLRADSQDTVPPTSVLELKGRFTIHCATNTPDYHGLGSQGKTLSLDHLGSNINNTVTTEAGALVICKIKLAAENPILPVPPALYDTNKPSSSFRLITYQRREALSKLLAACRFCSHKWTVPCLNKRHSPTPTVTQPGAAPSLKLFAWTLDQKQGIKHRRGRKTGDSSRIRHNRTLCGAMKCRQEFVRLIQFHKLGFSAWVDGKCKTEIRKRIAIAKDSEGLPGI
ncbi:hypothetical protein PoB_001089500 [Plakobranchus ocellatus]|uniref:Uncharacterized protein n=1 Tax=Plakobranchus ocellatus TaxID=259542 RepID=A0AAV3YNU6_9GAST|nr:hypothetical protein PoB_001089500 [Plakobranchus ocellatus]